MPSPTLLAFLQRIPKTDLHVHLDGSLRLTTLLELARARRVALPSDTPEGLRETVFKDHYRDLPDYLQGFAYTTAVMQDAEALERVACEFAEDNLAEGVRYVEVRFAPQLHMREDFSFRAVVEAVARGLERARAAHNARPEVLGGSDLPFAFGIIVCALRWFRPEFSRYYANLAAVMPYAREKTMFAAASLELARAAVREREENGLPIVGFDLAGAENGYPADDHREAFQHAHRHFLRKTVHAGEAYGPESIFQAITLCYANRIGHGTHLFAADQVRNPLIRDRDGYVHQLVQYMANQRICIEVNLTSNLQTLPSLRGPGDHPLRQMLEHNLSATLCTDNRLVSNTTVTRELALAADHLDLTRRQLRNLVVAGFKGSFFPGTYNEKRAYIRKVIDRYDALEAELLPPGRDTLP
jgi:adenosine deaminase